MSRRWWLSQLFAVRTGRASLHSGGAGNTIFALSSGQGKCGVAVVRVSGPCAGKALAQLTSIRDDGSLPVPRKAALRTLYHPISREKLDKALTLWFPGPRSFTGEDCAELHVHGGLAVVRAVLDAIAQLGTSFRPAEPGEFTKRAFFAGKLDLAQVEGLGDLIHADTEQQRRQAVRQMEGDLSKIYEQWRSQLVRLSAHLESFIDFSESEMIEDGVLPNVENGVHQLAQELKRQLSDARAGERLRNGVRVAIVGEPNVGKSSLLNLLTRRPAAIVSPMAGTTRDVIETYLDLGGFPITLVDTAGLRRDGEESSSIDVIEEEGVNRAVKNANEADLVVVMLDAQRVTELSEEAIMRSANQLFHLFGLQRAHKSVLILNKIDLLREDDRLNLVQKQLGAAQAVNILSCTTCEGLDHCLAVLERSVADLCMASNGDDGWSCLNRERHVLHTRRALTHLEAFLEAREKEDLAMRAQRLRLATREIGAIAGKVSSEQILDVIFADFCVGK